MVSAIIAILISLVIGGVAYFVTNSNIPTGTIKVSKREFLIGLAASTLVLIIAAPLTEHLIISNKERYYEYFNGYETAATEQVTACDRDGSCDHTYNCDPYITVETYTDSDGDVHTRLVTHYHHCPYVRSEAKYVIATTLGDYPIGGSFSKDRNAWRAGEAVPADIPAGPPQLWAEARARLDAGKPGGVTKVHQYKNFLLASDQTILDQHSDDISQFIKKGLLPPHTRNYSDPIYNEYQADKFQLVKLNADPKAWNEALGRLDGYLGAELQGDVHMAAIDAKLVSNQDQYSQALFAYWKSPQNFQRYALPKNALGVVVGVKDGKIEWARATGALPVGNEALLMDIQNNLVGVKFDPAAVIGTNNKDRGALWQTLYGTHKFKRPCMECVQEKQDGYQYLKSDIYVTSWQRFWIIFIATTLSATMWAAFLVIDDSFYGRYY